MRTILEYIKRSILGFLAIVLFSNMTFAFSIDIHYCQDRVQSVTYFGKKSSCQMIVSSNTPSEKTMDSNGSSSHSNKNFSSKSCCSNKQFSQDVSFEHNSQIGISVKQQHLDLIVVPTIQLKAPLHLDDQYSSQGIPFPPLIPWNQHRISFQVFQI